MGLSEFRDQASKSYRKNGFRGALQHSVLQAWNRTITRIGDWMPYRITKGDNPYDFEWDALIILDACRPDALAELSPEYPFIPDEIQTIQSVGTNSPSWIANTFSGAPTEEVRNTVYVSANGHTDTLGDTAPAKSEFGNVVEVWRDGWDGDLGLIPPQSVTQRAVQANNLAGSDTRLILHYMQPHIPYPSLDFRPEKKGEGFWTVWNELMCGAISREEAFNAYLDTLRWVLDDIALLLCVCEFDRPVISADHGELFGEHGIYGHSPFPIPPLQTVPWIELSPPFRDLEDHVADDAVQQLREMAADPLPDATEECGDVEEKLRALGYRM